MSLGGAAFSSLGSQRKGALGGELRALDQDVLPLTHGSLGFKSPGVP